MFLFIFDSPTVLSVNTIGISNILKPDNAKILYKDEIMYAIGNIIQNSVMYSKSSVYVEI